MLFLHEGLISYPLYGLCHHNPHFVFGMAGLDAKELSEISKIYITQRTVRWDTFR